MKVSKKEAESDSSYSIDIAKNKCNDQFFKGVETIISNAKYAFAIIILIIAIFYFFSSKSH